MIQRKVSKNKYFFAFIITLVVFSLGLLLGLVIESKRIQLIEIQDQQQKLDFNSLQSQYQLIDLFGAQKNCGALKKTFEESIKNLGKSRVKLEKYLESSNLNKKEFSLLKREYTLAQINFWLLTKKTKDICNLEHADIFYFYGDDQQCPDCSDQAYVLTYLKDKLGANLLNFVFDSQLTDEPLIAMLKESYGVTKYPTLIINGKKFDGFVSKDNILKEICPVFTKTKVNLCPESQPPKIIKIS